LHFLQPAEGSFLTPDRIDWPMLRANCMIN